MFHSENGDPRKDHRITQQWFPNFGCLASVTKIETRKKGVCNHPKMQVAKTWHVLASESQISQMILQMYIGMYVLSFSFPRMELKKLPIASETHDNGSSKRSQVT
jgi:hypothetical protein